MHIGLAGPIDVTSLQDLLPPSAPQLRRGYSFPMLAELAKEYIRQGHLVSIFSLDPACILPEVHHGQSIDIYVIPQRTRAKALMADAFRQERRLLLESMLDAQPDVIHAHWTYEFALAAQTSRLPTLITAHDWSPAVFRHSPDLYRLLRALMQLRCLAGRPAMTTVSPYLINRFHKLSPDITLIPNGIADSWFNSSRKVERQRKYLMSVNSGFVPRKNVHTLMRAFSKANLAPEIQLKLVGPDYEPDGKAFAWAAKERLTTGVEFVGPMNQEDLKDLYDGAAALVSPSLEESFGMTILEAMTRGTPVVGGVNSGAVSWLLHHSKGNFATDVRNVDALAGALKLAGRDSALNFDLSSLKKFRMSNVAKDYIRRLEKLAEATC